MYYNARWYDPGISQFTSPDTIIPNLYNSADWNRYGYARYNPLKYTDPSGHDPEGNCYDKGYCPDPEVVGLGQKIHSTYKNIVIKDVSKWNLLDVEEIDSGLNKIIGKNGFNGDMDAFVTAFGEVTFVPAANGSLGQQEDSITGKLVNNAATTLNGIVKVTPKAGIWTIVHEMGHVLSAAPMVGGRTTSSYGKMYSNVFDHTQPGTTLYGTTNTGEDFADSFYAVIRYGPNNMPNTSNKISPSRIQVIIALMQSYTDLNQTTGR